MIFSGLEKVPKLPLDKQPPSSLESNNGCIELLWKKSHFQSWVMPSTLSSSSKLTFGNLLCVHNGANFLMFWIIPLLMKMITGKWFHSYQNCYFKILTPNVSSLLKRAKTERLDEFVIPHCELEWRPNFIEAAAAEADLRDAIASLMMMEHLT